jgi:glycosyltransferase involved in cell wall biosynthesis
MKKSVVIYGVKTFPSQGGTDRVAENLALQLKGKYNITLYCYKSPLAQNHIDGIRVVQFTPWMKGAMGVFIYFFVSAVYLLFEKKVDLVHAHKTDGAFFIPLLRLRFKVISTSHEAPYKRDKWNWFIKLYFELAERMFVKLSNISTCVSKPLTQYYERKYHKKVHFIPNGINNVEQKNYDSTLATTFLPKGASLDKDFILFSARRLMATKGCHTMLEALHKVHYAGQVFIAGELHANDPYLRKLKRLSFGLNVHFLGFVSPLPPLFALIHQAQLFIFPSETEGMSIMLLEVASVGVPIIASDIPENTQVFNDSEVLYFKTKNPNDLAGNIRFALAHPKNMHRLGHNAQQKVVTDYLWSSLALSYSLVYEEAMMI